MFTSCGTESDNTAIYLALEAASVAGTVPHVVTTNIEHPAIEQCKNAVRVRETGNAGDRHCGRSVP